jgi:hypothetical protein
MSRPHYTRAGPGILSAQEEHRVGAVVGFFKWTFIAIVLFVLWAILESALRLILLLVAAGGGYLGIRSGISLFRRQTRPRLALNPKVVRPGDVLSVRYEPPASGTQDQRATRIRLLCRESRERRAGNRTVTDSHEWVVEEVDGQTRGVLELTIPIDGMHSFASRHHEISWEVEAQARNRGGGLGPAVREPFTVLPDRPEP